MSRKLALTTIAAACALCLALVACGGGSASSSAASSSAASSASSASSAASSATGSSASSATASSAASPSAASSAASSAEASSSAASASDNHNSYFVGKWDLYETADATHEQVVEVMEKYANDEAVRKQMNEAYGRDNIEFCARFNADGTGEVDTGAEIVPFTWEATNEGAITFTSFNGNGTAIHLPVTDGKFTLNGDTYAKTE